MHKIVFKEQLLLCLKKTTGKTDAPPLRKTLDANSIIDDNNLGKRNLAREFVRQERDREYQAGDTSCSRRTSARSQRAEVKELPNSGSSNTGLLSR